MSVRIPQIIAAAALALALGGCDDSGSASKMGTATPAPVRTVDDSTVESGITQDLSSSGAEVTKVTCPSDQKVQVGSTFRCTVTWSNGATGKVEVTQQGAGRYTYEPVAGSVQIPGASVDEELEAQLAKEGAPNATVNCPDTIVVKTGTTVTCDVKGGSGNVGGTVTFTFSSAEGTVDPSSVSTG